MESLKSINIAISPCPNDTFIFGYLLNHLIEWNGPEIKVDYLDIQALNEAVLSGENKYDFIKCFYAVYPKISKAYDLSMVGGALGLGVGPLLVGKPGLKMEERSVVYIPGYDTTAYQLLKLYGPKGIEVKPLRYDLLIEELCKNEKAMGVVIHESRFTYESLGLELLIDLGDAWEKDTSMPLPLGGPVIKKSMSEKLKEELVDAIKASLSAAWKDRSPIVDYMGKHAQEMDLEVMSSHIDLYVNDYSLNLGEKGLAAINKLTGFSA